MDHTLAELVRHIGRFLGIDATGRRIVQPFVVVLTFKDGLMEAIPALHALQYRRAA